MPAYNAEKTVEKTYRDIPQGVVDEVILVDDNSHDNTVKVARELGLIVIEHLQNRGYGGNQKTCYKEALSRGADVVVMIHPDYQYDSRLTPKLIEPILKGIADIVIGSRIRTRQDALSGGMPFYKYLGNRFLTLIENIVMGQNLSEFHTGFRAYSRRFLETIPFEHNSEDFVFDTEVLVQAVVFGFKIAEIPVPTRYFPEASSINFRRSVTYGIATLWTLVKYILHKAGLVKWKIFTRCGKNE
ncbi:glycosyltransferase family 2 protein [bacterium]|nr:glycosyltransferase family 2 protein [bacterium]